MPLLTGDKALRELADGEQIEVKGTIWLVEQLISEKIITLQEARMAYARMRGNARRLPWVLVEKSLAAFI